MKPSTKPLSPLEKGDHPEINDSEFLDDNGTQTYQSLPMEYIYQPVQHCNSCYDDVELLGTTSSWSPRAHQTNLWVSLQEEGCSDLHQDW